MSTRINDSLESNTGIDLERGFREEFEVLLSGLNEEYFLTIDIGDNLLNDCQEKINRGDPVSKMELVNTLSSMVFSPDLESVEEISKNNYLFHYTYPFIKTSDHGGKKELTLSNTLAIGLDTENLFFYLELNGDLEKINLVEDYSELKSPEKIAEVLLSSAEEKVKSGVPTNQVWKEEIIRYFSQRFPNKESLLKALVENYRKIIKDENTIRERASDLTNLYKMMKEYKMDFLGSESSAISLSHNQRILANKLKDKGINDIRKLVISETSSTEFLRTNYHEGARLLLSRVGISNTQFMMAVERMGDWEFVVTPNIVISEEPYEKAYVFHIGKQDYVSVYDESTEPAKLEKYESFIRLGNSMEQDRILINEWVLDFREYYPRFPFEIDMAEVGTFHEKWRSAKVSIPFNTLDVLSDSSNISPRSMVEEWGRFLESKIKNLE
jgi:phosphopantetheinyl transferase (holo-ACP synthase)